jgi:hypothetical protein
MATLSCVEKITFGDSLPGYVCGSVKDPAVIVIQMSACAQRCPPASPCKPACGCLPVPS